MGNTLSKIYMDNFQVFENKKNNYRHLISYDDFKSMCGCKTLQREIKTPVEDRFHPHACVLEYTKITGKFVYQAMGQNARDCLDRRVNS
jgi:hypothetical protein